MVFMPISSNVMLGHGVKIFQPDLVNLYGCTVGDETKVGAFVEVKNAIIGSRCKISSHTFICEGVTIEDDVFIATEPERCGGAGLRVVEIMHPDSQSMARRSPGGVTTHFPAGDGIDPQSRMQ
jgi:NDP-sugar pyrophosphorylase family protein